MNIKQIAKKLVLWSWFCFGALIVFAWIDSYFNQGTFSNSRMTTGLYGGRNAGIDGKTLSWRLWSIRGNLILATISFPIEHPLHINHELTIIQGIPFQVHMRSQSSSCWIGMAWLRTGHSGILFERVVFEYDDPAISMFDSRPVFPPYAIKPHLSRIIIVVPHIYIILILALPSLWVFRNLWKRRHHLQLNLCTHCGYDLRASKDRCPECGTVIPSPHPATNGSEDHPTSLNSNPGNE
jgi:hypothetical protein